MHSEYVSEEIFNMLLTALMPANRLALRVSLATGLRIGDVLALKTEAVRKSNRPTVKEQKTGKSRRIYLPDKLRLELLQQAGRVYVFEGRTSPLRPRTRAAVYKDLRRVARLYRVDGKRLAAHISPHSARKTYAVKTFQKSGDIRKIQRLLNHSDPAVTMVYAMADILTAKAHRK